jgi:RNA polymerase sigma-70 factor (ECF subfamily)
MPGVEAQELRALYERYAPVIHRRAGSLLGRDADAWDIVHEVFEKVLSAGPAFRREAQPMTYIYRVTTNLCLNVLRSQRVRADATEQLSSRDEAVVSGDGSADARSVLHALVGELDDRALTIAALHFVDGLTQEEIVDVVNLSRKTVGKELQRVRAAAARLAGVSEEGEVSHG